MMDAARAFRDIFPEQSKPIIGMIHLPALPGSPHYQNDWCSIVATAVRDAKALAEGGADGLVVENFGDVPFYATGVGPETVAAMTAVAQQIRQGTPIPMGINVLRNDGKAALAIARAVGADFVRVNVLASAAVTDQGIIQGQAADLMRYRKQIDAQHIAVLADVRVKHSAPLVQRPLCDEIEELIYRSQAGGLIVSGTGTGKPTDIDHLREVKRIAGDCPVLVGSGVNTRTLPSLAPHAYGFIVGTSLKNNGEVWHAVDVSRVQAMIQSRDAL